MFTAHRLRAHRQKLFVGLCKALKAVSPEMIRFLTRAVGLLVLAAGFAVFVVDGTRSIAGGELSITPLSELLKSRLPALEQIVDRNLHPLLWDPLALGLLRLPAWLVLSLFGLLLIGVAARRKPAVGTSLRS